MECPYCHKQLTEVTNSRPTRHNSQIWRRRICLHCQQIFTTHEIVDLSQVVVVKKSGKPEMFSRFKLYSGIHGAMLHKTPNRELISENLTREIEREILFLKRKKISTTEIADIVLKKLRKSHTSTFMRFLAYCKDIKSDVQMQRELQKYMV